MDPHSQLDVIYRQLGRSTGFRGFTPAFLLAVALASIGATLAIGLAGARWTLPTVAIVWVGVGAVIALVVAATVLVPALRTASGIRRASAKATAVQMAFPLGTGLAVTIVILANHPGSIPMLPSIWLALFGLGVASLGGLIRERVEAAALFYLLAAGAVYLVRPATPVGFTVAVGVPFAVGHAATAWLLRSRGP